MSEFIERIRQTAHELVERMKTDSVFKAQVKQNPEATLVAAGLPRDAVPEFLRETQASGEVNAYIYCSWSCVVLTATDTAP